MTRRKNGSQGASNIASTPLPTRKVRSVLTSRSPCVNSLPWIRPSNPSSTRGPSARSSAMPADASSFALKVSSNAIKASAKTAAAVSAISVSSLRLVMTRSNTCRVYSGATSRSRLMARLNSPA